MRNDSLERFIEEIKSTGPMEMREGIKKTHRLIGELIKAQRSEPWLAELLQNSTLDVHQELYRDPNHGFVLLAHSENKGRYRVPHDHGNGWVIYAVLDGETEMRTFSRVTAENGVATLKQKDSYRLKAGDSRIYLPGDIHDTRCLSDSILMLRFTSLDLKNEDSEGRITRYPAET